MSTTYSIGVPVMTYKKLNKLNISMKLSKRKLVQKAVNLLYEEDLKNRQSDGILDFIEENKTGDIMAIEDKPFNRAKCHNKFTTRK